MGLASRQKFWESKNPYAKEVRTPKGKHCLGNNVYAIALSYYHTIILI